jgi:hypothetical protein
VGKEFFKRGIERPPRWGENAVFLRFLAAVARLISRQNNQTIGGKSNKIKRPARTREVRRMPAKDGTNRGGYRVGAGRKKKSLAEKVLDGQAKKSDVPEPPAVNFDEVVIPEPRDFINEAQRGLAGVTNEDDFDEESAKKAVEERGCADAI